MTSRKAPPSNTMLVPKPKTLTRKMQKQIKRKDCSEVWDQCSGIVEVLFLKNFSFTNLKIDFMKPCFFFNFFIGQETKVEQ